MLEGIPKWLWMTFLGLWVSALFFSILLSESVSTPTKLIILAIPLFGIAYLVKAPLRNYSILAGIILLGIGFYLVRSSKDKDKDVSPNRFPSAVSISQADFEEFTLNAGEEKSTFEIEEGSIHIIYSNKPFLALASKLDGTPVDYKVPAGQSSWKGGSSGRFLAKGLEDGTVVRFRQVR